MRADRVRKAVGAANFAHDLRVRESETLRDLEVANLVEKCDHDWGWVEMDPPLVGCWVCSGCGRESKEDPRRTHGRTA